MSSSVLSWRPILQAWLQKLAEQQASALKHCFDCCYQVRATGTQLDLFIILIFIRCFHLVKHTQQRSSKAVNHKITSSELSKQGSKLLNSILFSFIYVAPTTITSKHFVLSATDSPILHKRRKNEEKQVRLESNWSQHSTLMNSIINHSELSET